LRATLILQLALFRQADVLVVELEHVKRALVERFGFNSRKIIVIHNCVSSLYTDESLWQPMAPLAQTAEVRLGYVGRDYPHKNTRIFPDIVRHLANTHCIAAKVFVTFTQQEWEGAGEEFRRSCVNVGPLTAAQCPTFYRDMDAVVFPSLLECFSSTPLEAMAMQVPLFASDRHFNREICGEHAHYFDPLDAEQAASIIAQSLRPKAAVKAQLAAARNHAVAFQSPSRRAAQYLALLAD
jgi:glycosyltransferase involved in cell wall biosynthesis